MEKAGFKVLAGPPVGLPQRVTAKKEVKSAADLKGLKIRTIPTRCSSPRSIRWAPTHAMNFGEIYTLCIAACWTAMSTPRRHHLVQMYEVACCMALTKHLMDPTFLVFSLPSGRSCRRRSRRRWQKAATGGARWCARWRRSAEGEALAQVKKLGMKVNEIDTAPW